MTSLENKAKMPVIFLGHGSPTNVVDKNEVTDAMKEMARKWPTPKAILMISAHWTTKGTWVTHMGHPRTIHDFYGFADELYDFKYSAPGSPELAESVQKIIGPSIIHLDDSQWGLDHGAWSVLTHLYPKANIPVVQMSLDMTQGNQYHFDLGQKLSFLRSQGVLILGSGNIIHNLNRISWESQAPPQTWAQEFDKWVKEKALNRNFSALISETTETEYGKLSLPTTEHYIPFLYILGASDSEDELYFDIEAIQNSSISMRSFRFTTRGLSFDQK